ncbi:uncharacterized protein [Diadema setosum]|uniref:uncharacterized protein n=1 Tax=Diadema setosum TaxID=31175 RepID=UPI003B3B29DF
MEQPLPNFGLLFDIDGVLVRGKNVLPEALEAFQLLCDSKGAVRVPTVFVTNAGNSLREQKAKQLTDILNVKVGIDEWSILNIPLHKRDNPMTDIYGANLYNHYLTYMNMSRVKKSVSLGSSTTDPGDKYRPSLCGTVQHQGDEEAATEVDLNSDWNDIIAEEGAESIESVLVCTGVHSKAVNVEQIERESEMALDHGHRDFKFNEDLCRPTIEVNDVLEAIKRIFELEKFS